MGYFYWPVLYTRCTCKYDGYMSSQPKPFIPGIAGETRSSAVARRLRGQLAERNVTVSELARRLGVPQQKLQRRHAGKTEFKLDEIDDIAAVTGIDAVFLLTGLKTETPPTRGGGIKSLHTESNRGPFHYKRNPSRPNPFHAVPNGEDMARAA